MNAVRFAHSRPFSPGGSKRPPDGEVQLAEDFVDSSGIHEVLEEALVDRVRQPIDDPVQPNPRNEIDLFVGLEGAGKNGHQPVPDFFHTAVSILVENRREVGLVELALEPGLLQHLTQRSMLELLARLKLPLRETPVVVPRPVNQKNFRPLLRSSDDYTACSLDLCVAHDQPPTQSRRAVE